LIRRRESSLLSRVADFRKSKLLFLRYKEKPMPLYEYTCRSCNDSFEALVFGDEAVECPECQSDKVEKLLSVPGRPKVNSSADLPMACNSEGPPCGAPWCRRS
jgi:putative FmdB family regulatory protein